MIYLYEDGLAGYEECGTGKYGQRVYAASDFIGDKFVICGGDGQSNCEMIDENGKQSLASHDRQYAASVKLNQSTILITGGMDSWNVFLKSTEFVTIDGSTTGPNLNFKMTQHCMVKFKPNEILQIGGDYGLLTKTTWIIDPKSELDMTEGPSMINARSGHSCGTVNDKYENVLIIVAGGNFEGDYIEILNTTTMEKWVPGKTIQ